MQSCLDTSKITTETLRLWRQRHRETLARAQSQIQTQTQLNSPQSPPLKRRRSDVTSTAPPSVSQAQTSLSQSQPQGGSNEKKLDSIAAGASDLITPRDEVIPSVCRPYISSLTKKSKSDSSTVQFKGLDVISDLVPTLEKIWSKHGNIAEKSTLRNGDMLARALESLATAVLILEDNSARSLNDHQAEYLSTALFDLQCMRFEVEWLVPTVEKALALHRSKPLLDSLKNLRQSKSHAAEMKSKLLDDLAKVEKVERELEEDMAMLSQKIPFSEEVELDQQLGVGLA